MNCLNCFVFALILVWRQRTRPLWLVDSFFCFYMFVFPFFKKEKEKYVPCRYSGMSIYRRVLCVLSYLSSSCDLSRDFLFLPSPFFGFPLCVITHFVYPFRPSGLCLEDIHPFFFDFFFQSVLIILVSNICLRSANRNGASICISHSTCGVFHRNDIFGRVLFYDNVDVLCERRVLCFIQLIAF